MGNLRSEERELLAEGADHVGGHGFLCCQPLNQEIAMVRHSFRGASERQQETSVRSTRHPCRPGPERPPGPGASVGQGTAKRNHRMAVADAPEGRRRIGRSAQHGRGGNRPVA